MSAGVGELSQSFRFNPHCGAFPPTFQVPTNILRATQVTSNMSPLEKQPRKKKKKKKCNSIFITHGPPYRGPIFRAITIQSCDPNPSIMDCLFNCQCKDEGHLVGCNHSGITWLFFTPWLLMNQGPLCPALTEEGGYVI